jgi:hypothetical protein
VSYKIEITSFFKKQAKRLLKKYPSLKAELEFLVNNLETAPQIGIALGNNCFKIRIAIASKGKGKAGSARIITHFKIQKNTVYLLSIYDKSDQENLSDNELIELLRLIV